MKGSSEMSIFNLMAIIAILVLAIFCIRAYTKSKKNAEVVQTVDVDDQTYTLEKMIEFVKRRLDEITKVVGTITEEELQKYHHE